MKTSLSKLLPFLMLFAFWSCNKQETKKAEVEQKGKGTAFYVGTYTNKDSKGIYKYKLLENGKVESIGLVAQTESPSFLTKSVDNKYLLAVSESEKGTVESYKIGKDSLEFINRSKSGGAHPCFVTVNDAGQVLVANYSGGNISLLELMSNGELSSLLDVQQHHGKGPTNRQKAPHAHSTWFAPTNNSIVSVDLGTDELIFSTIDAQSKKLVPYTQHKLKMEAGAGPRHLSFHPNNKWIYVVNELNSTVSLVTEEEGKYTLKSSVSTLPEEYTEKNLCADIHVSKDGKFLYVSNRGHNSIAIFSINENGELTSVGHELTRGDWPRNFALSPDNNFLLVAHQHSGNIVSFKRNTETGELDYISEIMAGTPVCILF